MTQLVDMSAMTHDQLRSYIRSLNNQLFELHLKRKQLETLLWEAQQGCEHPVEYREAKSESVYFCGLCGKCIIGEQDD